jgi:hypothetical protein
VRFYRHTTANDYGVFESEAWITRITYRHNDEPGEIWQFWLPSFGYIYQINFDREMWAQRGFQVNLRTGKFRMVSRVINYGIGPS